MTTYSNDEKRVWRALTRDLVNDGYLSAAIHHNPHLIDDYVKELGKRGVLDDATTRSRIP